MYQALFKIKVGNLVTMEGIQSAVDEITGVGYVTNLDQFSFTRRELDVAIDADSLWDLAVCYETLRGTLAAIALGEFTMPERPDVFNAGSRVEAGVSR